MGQRLAVERVQESVARPVGGGTAAVCLATLAEVTRLTAKGTLVAVWLALVVVVVVFLFLPPCRTLAYILPSSVREKGQP